MLKGPSGLFSGLAALQASPGWLSESLLRAWATSTAALCRYLSLGIDGHVYRQTPTLLLIVFFSSPPSIARPAVHLSFSCRHLLQRTIACILRLPALIFQLAFEQKKERQKHKSRLYLPPSRLVVVDLPAKKSSSSPSPPPRATPTPPDTKLHSQPRAPLTTTTKKDHWHFFF